MKNFNRNGELAQANSIKITPINGESYKFDPTTIDDEHKALLESLVSPLAKEEEEIKLAKDMQRTLLGGFIFMDRFQDFIPKMKAGYFQDENHRIIFDTFKKLSEKYGRPSFGVLRNEIEAIVRNRGFDDDGNALKDSYLSELESIKEFYEPVGMTTDYLLDQLKQFIQRQEYINFQADLAHDVKSGKPLDAQAYGDRFNALLESREEEDEFEECGYGIEELAALVPPEQQLQGHFSQGDTVIVAAPAGAGKSFLAMYMGLSIATGKPFLKTYKTAKGGVAYLNSEGKYNYRARALAWVENYNSVIPPKSDFYVMNKTFDFVKGRGQVLRLAKHLKKKLNDPKLVIIDNLNNNFGGNDKCKGTDMQKAMDNFRILSTELNDATILILHNFGREMDREKDAVELRDGADAIFFLEPKDKDNLPQNKILTIKCSKGKDLDELPPYRMIKHQTVIDGKSTVWWKIETESACRLQMLNRPEHDLAMALYDQFDSFGFTTAQATKLATENDICQERRVYEILSELTKQKLIKKLSRGNYQVNPTAVEAFIRERNNDE